MSEEINRTITRNADDSFGALPEDAELAFSPQKDYESLNIPEVDGDDVFVRQQRKSDSISSLSSEGSRQSSKSRFRKFSRFNATSPQRNRVDQINSEYRWLQCTDLISGEEFYLNQTTGESFTDLPSKSHRRMESNPERASFVNQSRAHPGISIVSNAASDTELSLNSPQTSALRFVDVLAIIDGMETQLSDILDCLDSKDSSLIFDSNTIEHIRNAKKELHQALENEESLGGSVSDFSDIHSILERSHPLVNYESESARQFRKSVVNNFDLNDLSDVNDVETRRSSVEVTNIFYKKSQELSACKLLMNERLNLYDELLERHDLPIERLLPRYFSTSISFSYKENLVIVCVLFLPNEFFKILENKTVVNSE